MDSNRQAPGKAGRLAAVVGLVAAISAGPAAATDDLQAWLGAWHGTVRQGHDQYGVEMLLRPADAEGRVGLSHYAQLGCSGHLSRDTTLPGQGITFRETYFQGPHCLGYRGGRISLSQSGADARWSWHDAGGRLVATGTVSRSTPSAGLAQLAGPAAPVAAAGRPSPSPSREPPVGQAPDRRIASLEGFYVVNVGRDLGSMHVSLLRYVVRGGDAAAGFAYELHGVASTDPNDHLSIGRAAYRGRWWPDTQQFEEEHGFPAPSCTFWRYHGWTAPLTPATVDLGGRAVAVWQHRGPSPAHRRAAMGRVCKALEFDLTCRRAVRCHRWQEQGEQGDGAWVLVASRADAMALYEHASARGRLDVTVAAPTAGAAAVTAARPVDESGFVARPGVTIGSAR